MRLRTGTSFLKRAFYSAAQNSMASRRAALVSICHGAGPLPLLGDPSQQPLIRTLNQDIRKALRIDSDRPPKAIAVLTAHWQTKRPAISASKKVDLYYDYSGFPGGYDIEYEAEGQPEIAQKAYDLLEGAGFAPRMDTHRGWDHGTFVPMKLIEPNGSIPIVQISILASQNPAELLRMGSALAPLRDDNVAFLGSGSPSYHDVQVWMSGQLIDDKEFAARQIEWNTALENVLDDQDNDRQMTALQEWRKLPHSYEMHPHGAAEHFNTLLLCAGAARSDEKIHCLKSEIWGAIEASFWWE